MAKSTREPRPQSDVPAVPAPAADPRAELAPVLVELGELVVLKKLHAERARAFDLVLRALGIIGRAHLAGESPALMTRALEHEPALTHDQAVGALRAFVDGPAAPEGRVPGNLVKWLTKLTMELLLAP